MLRRMRDFHGTMSDADQGLGRAGGLGRVPARATPPRACRQHPARHPRRRPHGPAGRGAGVRDAGGRDPAVSRLGLPALRPRVAQPGAGLGTHRHAGAVAGQADRPAHRPDHGQRAGAARAAALRVRRRQHGPDRQRPGEAGEAGRVPGSQRLRPRRHGDGAGRIRHARRHHRHLPVRRGRTRPAGPVRRHHRVDPGVRPVIPAQRRQARHRCRCGRCPKCRWARSRSPASAPAGATCSARTRRRTRSICRSPTGAAIRAWSTGCRCSIRRWKICWTTCRTPRSAWITSPTRCWKRGWR